mmetsp:Transcript_70710/g.118213  ORF Transcript_70710/g.118213 Transcript_70710/m.118213 type:complete len:223 (-) Transcript_70710:273-941(-)
MSLCRGRTRSSWLSATLWSLSRGLCSAMYQSLWSVLSSVVSLCHVRCRFHSVLRCPCQWSVCSTARCHTLWSRLWRRWLRSPMKKWWRRLCRSQLSVWWSGLSRYHRPCLCLMSWKCQSHTRWRKSSRSPSLWRWSRWLRCLSRWKPLWRRSCRSPFKGLGRCVRRSRSHTQCTKWWTSLPLTQWRRLRRWRFHTLCTSMSRSLSRTMWISMLRGRRRRSWR